MYIAFIKSLASNQRAPLPDFVMASLLTFVAGAVNAGGFFAVRVHTAHMTGIVASVADFLALGNIRIALSALGALVSFILGAGSTAVMVNWAKRRRLHSVYALPLLYESLWLTIIAILGFHLDITLFASFSLMVMLFSFLMGLQNALVTKVTNARIRTTHITGMVTDIGIELGKLFYWNIDKTHPQDERVTGNRKNITMLSLLVALFFSGGLLGAVAYRLFGTLFILPLAAMLCFIALFPLYEDLKAHWLKISHPV